MTTPLTKQNTKRKQPLGNYSPNEILFIFLSRWYWFVLSVLVTTGYSVYNILTTQPVYTRNTLVHIESNSSSLSEQMENFANMGTGKASTNAYNEIYNSLIEDEN